MSATRCARVGEVESARDGRLGPLERASLERHLPTCADCREEARALSELRARLAAMPTPEPDQLAMRRRRQQLLREADQAAVTPVSRPRHARAALLVAAAALVVVVAGAGLARRRAPHPVTTASTLVAPEIAVIRAREGARFTRVRDGIVERIDLREGELSIAVRHSDLGEHVLVTMPDGELEDLGTRFVVVVEAGATRAVSVQEGLVVLRLQGREPIHIAAGSSWTRPLGPAPSASVCAPAAVSVSPVALAPKATASVVGLASIELEAAMKAYRNGDHRAAAAKLAAIVHAYPHDPRSEDAAYVRVVALQRAGDVSAARGAAREYLARYPKGFRRPEVEPIAQ